MSAPGVWYQGLAVIRCPNPVRFGTQQLPPASSFSRKCGRRRLREGIKVGLTTTLCMTTPVGPSMSAGVAQARSEMKSRPGEDVVVVVVVVASSS